jgi:hypothetical protein
MGPALAEVVSRTSASEDSSFCRTIIFGILSGVNCRVRSAKTETRLTLYCQKAIEQYLKCAESCMRKL